MPTESQFLDQLFGSGSKARKIGEPLRRAKLPTTDEDDGIDFVSDAEKFKNDFGVSFSSTFRTPERNDQVGGTGNSYHLKGQAADIPTANLSAEDRKAVKSYWNGLGSYDVIDEGDHIHVEPRTGVKSKTGYGKGESGNTSPTATKPDGKKDAFLDQLLDPNAKPDFSNVKGSPKPAKKDDKGFLIESADNIGKWAQEQFGNPKDFQNFNLVPKALREPIQKKASQVLDHVSSRFLTNTGKIGPDDPRYNPSILALNPDNPLRKPTLDDYKRVDPNIEKRLQEKGKLTREKAAAAGPPPKGFIEQLKSENVISLILNDSLPVNVIEWASGGYENGYKNLQEAKNTLSQETIVANPENYPAVSVQAAKKAIADREAKQGLGVKDAWKDLKLAASEDPGRFAGSLVQALATDPYMILAPIGIGAKPIQAVQAARKATVASRALRVADNIMDAGITGAGLNVAIEAASAGSQGQNFTARNAGTAAIVGGATSALFGAFMKSKAAGDALASGNITKETFDQTIRDMAQGDLAVNDLLENDLKSPNTFVSVKHQVERATGVKFESAADLETYLKSEQKRWKALFKERDLTGQYQKALADERISRRQTLLEEQQARVAEGVSRKPAEIEAAYQESSGARVARFNDEYEKAIAQRDAMADGSLRDQALAENELRAAQSRLDQQDIMTAAMDGDVPAVKNAMLRAAQRDAKLRVPKWQRGEVDPRIVARLGVGTLFAGTAYAVADKDAKPGAALAAGLAGLIMPGAGGSVLRKMRQAGAVTEEGMITGLFKGRDPAEQLKTDTAIIERAKAGDQKALNELFNDNYHDIVRFANRKLAGVKGRIGMDGEDVANEVFAKAFAKIDQYESRVPYNAYLKKLTKDEVVDVFRRITAEKRGADFSAESMYNKFDSNDKTAPMSGEAEGGFSSAIRGDVEAAATDINSPEFQLEFMDATKRLKNIVDGLPEKQRQAFTMLNIDNLSLEEAAKAMGESYENVRQLSSRAENKITELLEKGYGARKVEKPKTTLYHGTHSSFDKFKPGVAWLTEDMSYATDFIDPANPSGAVIKVAAAPGKTRTLNIDKDASYRDNVNTLAETARADGYRYIKNSADGEVISLYPDQDLSIKRGRGRPRKQAGEVDPALLKVGAKVAIAGLAGIVASNVFTDTKDNEGNERADKQWAPLISGVGVAGLSAFLLLSKGRGGSSARAMTTAVDELFGASSTRILNKTPKVFGAIQHTIRATAGETHKYIEATTPFLRRVAKLPRESQEVLARALYTGRPEVINRILEAAGDKELIASYKGVRSVLDSLGDKLVNLKRFSKGAFEYFPRIIKDKEGLFDAIGKTKSDDITKILDEANVDSLKRSGKPLTGYEENALINSILFGGDHRFAQPGWAKNRGIEEITEKLLPFYASPAESLHTYIRSAVADIEKAKFFGQYARNGKNGEFEFLDVDASVGLMMRDDLATGKIDPKDANEVAGIIKDFFGKGQMGESDWIRRLKDVSYMGLLGNFLSTVTQLADIPVSVYTQDLRSTIVAVARQASGRKLISAKELGLVDNISQEFAGQERSTRALNRLLKTTLFSSVDQIGKNTSLNAAVIRAQRLAKSESGVTKISAKYSEIFGPKFNTLISDLKAGRISDEVKDYAWMELSRTQPISMLEMPQKYMAHPNARGYLMLKSFVMKQIDLVRRDAIQNMRHPLKEPAKFAKGVRNLTELSIVMGTAGAGTQVVKDWLQGKETKLELTDIPMNMIKNLGWSEYQLDKFRGVSRQRAQQRRDAGDKMARAQEARPIIATLELALPPFRIFDDVVRGDPNAIRYVVPGMGPWAAAKFKEYLELEKEMQDG